MSTDGNLRSIFQDHLRDAHWQAIESWSTGQGVPDVHYCFPGGLSGWVEFKLCSANSVSVSPHQVAWAERYSRAGGRTFIAVRRRAALKRCAPRDEIHLLSGLAARFLAKGGLSEVPEDLYLYLGLSGPSRWDWDRIRAALTSCQ